MKKFVLFLALTFLLALGVSAGDVKYKRSVLNECDDFPCVIRKPFSYVAGLQDDYPNYKACQRDLLRVQSEALHQLTLEPTSVGWQRYERWQENVRSHYLAGMDYCTKFYRQGSLLLR